MGSFRVEWRPSTKKDLRKIPPELITRIVIIQKWHEHLNR